MNADMFHAVYTMARAGLTEVAKTQANGPAAIAQAATILEQWRAETEKSLSVLPVTDAKAAP